jgi:hypothetical protein
MKIINKLLAAALLFSLSTPSAFALIISDNGTGGEVAGSPVYLPRYAVTVENADDVGTSFDVNYNFTLNNSAGDSETISATATYTILDFSGTNLDLGITVTNNSDPTVSILSFGMNAARVADLVRVCNPVIVTHWNSA